MYFSHYLVVYELPMDGMPVGHLWFKNGWLENYGLKELSIFYPASIKSSDKIGFKWLKCKDYGGRMNDTAKKDVRRKRR
jgi:hypothetical protein